MTGEPVRLVVFGANGRMGQAVVRLAQPPAFCVVADSGEVDVVVDFSAAGGVAAAADMAIRRGAALVSGTTGLDDTGTVALDAASRHVPVLWEPNMSVGIHVLGDLLARAVALLGTGFDIEIVEAHHRVKRDAPSGTALSLAQIARAARRESLPYSHGRRGDVGPRPRDEIGIHAVRGGDVIGDHTVLLLGDGERFELTHKASHRDVFARGALRAAAWISGRPAGRYTLSDVLSST